LLTKRLSDSALLLLSVIGLVSFGIYWLFLFLINAYFLGIWPEMGALLEWTIVILLPIVVPIALGAISAIFSFVPERFAETNVKARIALIIGIVDILLGVLQITWMMIAGLTC